jgi:hypothetical protein
MAKVELAEVIKYAIFPTVSKNGIFVGTVFVDKSFGPNPKHPSAPDPHAYTPKDKL